MKTQLIRPLDLFLGWGLTVLVFLLPLFFLPLTPDFFDFNKQALLVFGLGLLLLAWTGKMVVTGQVRLVRTPFDLPLIFLAAAYLLSTALNSAGRAESLAFPGATTTVVSLTLLYFIAGNNLTKEDLRRIYFALAGSAIILALVAVYQFVGLGPSLAPPGFIQPRAFTPASAPLPLLTFLGLVLVLILVLGVKEKERLTKLAYFLAGAIMLIGGVVTFSLVLPRQEASPILLPHTAGWSIAIESLKESPLFGVGPANFTTAFSRFRPVSFNQNLFWSLRFNSSSNFYFHLLTTVGVLGLATYLFLLWRLGRTLADLVGGKESWLELPGLPVFLPLGLIFILQIFLPATFVLLFLMFLLLALLGVSLRQAGSNLVAEKRLYLTSLKEGLVAFSPGRAETNLLPWFFFIPTAILVLAAFFLGGRAWWAEFQFKKALDAVVAGRGTDAYNRQIEAIGTNPFILRYRTSYAQTNLALANALAQNPPAGGLTDQDRATVSQLIQQAIREAKIATVLAPQNVASWENLARIYRTLINFAQGADTWAIASYQQAIIFDPVNPRLRLDLGGVYYALGNFSEAERHYRNAVALKPDLANAHYNLAVTLREQGKLEEAIAEMETTQSLVSPETADYQTATAELEALRQRLGESAEATPAARPETLIPPEPLPTGLTPPLDLPAELSP